MSPKVERARPIEILEVRPRRDGAPGAPEFSQTEGSEAFEAAVRSHVPALHASATRILRSDDLAWDAVQETLLRAWGYGALPEEPRALLLGLVRRSCLHILRCARRRCDHEHSAASAPSERCCSMDPVDALSHLEGVNVIEVAMAKLTSEHRESLRLVVSCGFSYRDAAAQLGVPIGTIRSRIARARAELRVLLGQSLDPSTPR